MSQITVAVAEPQVSHFQCARSRLGPYRYTTASARIMTTASAGHRAYLMISEAKEFKPTKLKRMGTTTSTATAASNITMASRVKSTAMALVLMKPRVSSMPYTTFNAPIIDAAAVRAE